MGQGRYQDMMGLSWSNSIDLKRVKCLGHAFQKNWKIPKSSWIITHLAFEIGFAQAQFQNPRPMFHGSYCDPQFMDLRSRSKRTCFTLHSYICISFQVAFRLHLKVYFLL